MATRGYRKGDEHSGDGIYRCVGNLTISRAATTEREIELMPDGMTIDVSGVTRMDTVGAWLIYRATRDRGAKVEGANKDVEGLLEQVRQADVPVRVVPETDGTGFTRTVAELGEYIVDAGRVLFGLLNFFGATLLGFWNVFKRPSQRLRMKHVALDRKSTRLNSSH